MTSLATATGSARASVRHLTGSQFHFHSVDNNWMRAIAVTGPVILRGTTANAAASNVIKIRHVSSQTGVFAPFAEAYPFTLDQIGTALAKGISNWQPLG